VLLRIAGREFFAHVLESLSGHVWFFSSLYGLTVFVSSKEPLSVLPYCGHRLQLGGRIWIQLIDRRKRAQKMALTASTDAMIPICVDQFLALGPDVQAEYVSTKAPTRDDVVRKQSSVKKADQA
jgi:hypothetical protein